MFTQARTVETVLQNPTITQPAVVAVPIQHAGTTVTYMQPITIPMTAPTQPVKTVSGQPQMGLKIVCPLYTHRKAMPD